jgi:uncharacterized repeat protein (TIGR03987 family)
MTLAFVFYTAAVWTEHVRRLLLPGHVVGFWAGLAFDALGTEGMRRLAQIGFEPGVHGIFGLTAFLLMLGHAVWATVVVTRGSDAARGRFHRYSLIVWLVWLLPYFGGMIAGMSRGFTR